AATEVEPLSEGAASAGALLAPPASVEGIAQASGGSVAPQALAQSPASEEARCTQEDVATSPVEARDEPVLPTGPARQEPGAADTGVAHLIPQLRPRPPALSPSVAPALGPAEGALARSTGLDATRTMEPGAPQSKAPPP